MTGVIRWGRLWCCVLVFVSCFAMSARAGAATAHEVPDVYPSRFAGTSEGFYWDPSVTNSTSPQAATLKDAIGDARIRWNELVGDFNIDKNGDGPEVAGAWDNCDNYSGEENYVSFEPMGQFPGPVLAVVVTCEYESFPVNIRTAQMRFDSTENWHYAKDVAPQDDESDMRSVAAHEWGHWTGWFGPVGAHFSNEGDYCGGHTMCPIIPDGTTFMRSLETHDIHTFNAAYR